MAPDPAGPAAILARIRERYRRWNGERYDPQASFTDWAALVEFSANDVPPLLGAVERALAHHVEAVVEDMPDPFRYCKTCSGHPAWPCPEVRDITAALAGKDGTDEK